MSYPPNIHQDSDKNHLIEVIKHYPLATVISIKDNTPFITHLPLIYKSGKLIGHIDKNNPQAKLLTGNTAVTVIFSGPDCYISPSLMGAEALPTWNYIKVHLQGTAIEIENENAIKQSMVDMTSFLEAPEEAYILDFHNPKMDQFVNYVMGFEIDITHWEGKFKLSQNKDQDIQNLAKQQLISVNKTTIKPFLDKVF
ncbi:FMN-binding negative transcriptional regulator [Formosa algae]|uniref:Transcriptional regulator n=1 Tax=Formosa algae TaxID=225843 RepID=A0A9X0YKR2_9FLAO|nr:FMN-binding negative transcriptional regulator [Formosa algae]MBP1839024.1 transcriptional regulator [Formosa algae]MDQ0333801.1 transcriptional regulator [Formosa algae]OEI78983.1 transcriptional regulator [Formosa algae]PNW29309.1 transcriptional regulator [Formosa algae]